MAMFEVRKSVQPCFLPSPPCISPGELRSVLPSPFRHSYHVNPNLISPALLTSQMPHPVALNRAESKLLQLSWSRSRRIKVSCSPCPHSEGRQCPRCGFH